MVDIFADIICTFAVMKNRNMMTDYIRRTQIIVLATSANALLAVGSAGKFAEIAVGINGAKENWLELSSGSVRNDDFEVNMQCSTWFMPALAKSNVGSLCGMVADDTMLTCSFFLQKKSTNAARTSPPVGFSPL